MTPLRLPLNRRIAGEAQLSKFVRVQYCVDDNPHRLGHLLQRLFRSLAGHPDAADCGISRSAGDKTAGVRDSGFGIGLVLFEIGDFLFEVFHLFGGRVAFRLRLLVVVGDPFLLDLLRFLAFNFRFVASILRAEGSNRSSRRRLAFGRDRDRRRLHRAGQLLDAEERDHEALMPARQDVELFFREGPAHIAFADAIERIAAVSWMLCGAEPDKAMRSPAWRR